MGYALMALKSHKSQDQPSRPLILCCHYAKSKKIFSLKQSPLYITELIKNLSASGGQTMDDNATAVG